MQRNVVAAVLITAGMLAACAPQAQIVSNKAASYVKEPKRLFVMTDIGGEWGTVYYNGFKARLTSLLSGCGAESYVSRITELELDDNLHLRRAQVFKADTVLNIRRSGGTKNQYGVFLNVTYDSRLSDVEAKKLVWRSNVKFARGLDGLKERGEELAVDIVKKLADDGILRTCPAAKAA